MIKHSRDNVVYDINSHKEFLLISIGDDIIPNNHCISDKTVHMIFKSNMRPEGFEFFKSATYYDIR